MDEAIQAIADGRQARKDGHLAKARGHYAKAAKVYRAADDLLDYAHTIRHIADIYLQECDPEKAKPLFEEALELYRSDLNTKRLDLANTVRPYALLLEEEGDSASAKKLWEEARNLYGSLRLHAAVSECGAHLV